MQSAKLVKRGVGVEFERMNFVRFFLSETPASAREDVICIAVPYQLGFRRG